MSGVYTSAPIRIDASLRGRDLQRADIVFEGVDQSGPSYEARVFVNNPGADAQTEATAANGYAGAFHVYGYGTPPPPRGDAGADEEGAPMTRYIVATEAIRAALAQGDEIVVTVVPVRYGRAETADVEMGVQRVSISVDAAVPRT